MAKESEKTRFYFDFCATMKVEHDLAKVPIIHEQEKQLDKTLIRLDFIIKKDKDPDVVLRDPIGEFFRMVNLFKCKSPEDGISIDDSYKAQGYGLIYEGFDRKQDNSKIILKQK